jgi:hypothetical protein
VHGIGDAELAAAPSWEEVASHFLAAIRGRHALAYNAPFDAGRILTTHSMAGLDVTELPRPDQWWCLMRARSVWARVGYWLPLGLSERDRTCVGRTVWLREQLFRVANLSTCDVFDVDELSGGR